MTSGKETDEHRFDTGAEIRRIRGNRTQQEFAELLGVGRNTIIRYETNVRMPDAEFLFKLNLLFKVDPSRVILGRDSVSLTDEREISLLKNYREALDEDQRAIERMADLAAQSARAKSGPTGQTNGETE